MQASAADSGQVIGRYRIRASLASSAHASVLLADDVDSGTTVVLKRFDHATRGAFLREAAAAVGSRHHRLCTPIDTIYAADSGGYLVFEYFPAGTLRNLLEREGKLGFTETIRLARHALEALAALHARNLIHCDVKPDNVFVRGGDASREFLLGDLGAACSVREAQNGRHQTGSPAYAAPERGDGRLGFTADLYSLGVMLFEAATGGPPFEGGPREVARAHASAPAPVERVANGFLRDLIGGLLEKDPAQRIQSAERALQMFGEDAAVPNRPVTQTSDLPRVPAVRQSVLGRRPPREVYRTLVPAGFERIHLLSTGRASPVLLAESNTDVAVNRLEDTSRTMILPKSGAIRLLGAGAFAYRSESTIAVWNLVEDQRHVLHDRCVGAIDFCASSDRLFWRTRRSGHLLELAERREISFLAPHYLLEARSHLLPEGNFAMSAGPTNSQILLRNAEGNVLRTVDLDGPVIEIESERTVMLAVTLNVSSRDNYAVWRVAGYSQPERLDMPLETRAIASTPGHLFWLVDETSIVQCGIGLSTRPVFRADQPVAGFAVSPDHAWIATWTRGEDQQFRVRVFSVNPEIAS